MAAIRVESFAERNHAAKISSSRGDSHNDSNETDNSNTKNRVVWTEQDEFLSKEMSLSSKLNTHGRPFPRPLFDDPRIDIHWVGYHNERSFGATPYIVSSSQKDNSNNKWIMVDTPKYCTNSVDAVLEVTGGVPPDYLFLTHVDDTADHNLWKHHFPSLQRIFHSGDLGVENWLGDTTLDDVEVLLPSIASTNNSIGLASYSLDGKVIDYDEWMSKSNDASSHDDDVIILHTPGHSKGSIMLYKRQLSKESNYNGVLFTGDTYAYTATPQGGRRMTSFPRYCNSRSMQAKTMPKLLQLQWDIIAPGHGHPRDYRAITDPSQKKQIQMNEMQDAIQELNVAVPKFASTL